MTVEVFDRRQDMIHALAWTGHVAELGVFRGEFAGELLAFCPGIERLDLVDAWGLAAPVLCSGNQDGNHIQYDRADALEAGVRARFATDPRVRIFKSWTRDYLRSLPDACLDAIYIDADHSYEGCSEDLTLAWSKVRSGGWIAGHDYEIRPERCTIPHVFGVQRAVDEFLVKHGLTLAARTLDGCASFAFRRP